MRYFKYFALLAVLVLPTVHSQAQVAIGVRIGSDYGLYNAPPVCAYGYYPDYPFGCAPYGYWGPEWFVDGVFIGAGPWHHFYYTHPVYYRHFYVNRGFGYRGGFEHFDHGFRGEDREFRERDRGFRGEEHFRGGHEFHGEWRGDRGFRGGDRGHWGGRGGEFRGHGDGDFHGRGGGEFHRGERFRAGGGGGRDRGEHR
jgi:hypothetical protein